MLNEGESDAIATFIVEIHARGFKYHDKNIQEGGLQISLNLMYFISLLTSVLAAFMFAGVGCEKSSCIMIASLWINESMFLNIAPFVALSVSLRSLIIELLLGWLQQCLQPLSHGLSLLQAAPESAAASQLFACKDFYMG